MAVYRAPFPTPESRRPTWRLLRQDILFIEPPSHQPACASSMMEYTSASFVAGFLLTLLWLLSSERKKEGATGNLVPVQERPTVVMLDHCGFRPMFLGCSQTMWAHSYVIWS